MPKTVVILGATGSIGKNALHVIRAHPERLRLIGIAGYTRYEQLASIAREFAVQQVVLSDPAACQRARDSELFLDTVCLRCGLEGLNTLAALPEADVILMAIAGTDALAPTLTALEAGKTIALASKEIFALAGRWILSTARRTKASLLPVDSETNAIFQCLQGRPRASVAKLILTASGGPFLSHSLEAMVHISPREALQHPNWPMGPKITVDSATMANKGLELIETRWLFDIDAHRIEIAIHPQSIVHSMVQWVDGSLIAQLSPPSMTFALQHALLYPECLSGVQKPLDFSQPLHLDFHPPDLKKFPCLRLARAALEASDTATAYFNAANEAAVTAFLNDQLPFLAIPKVIEKTLEKHPHSKASSLEDLLEIHAAARRLATQILNPTIS